MLKTLFSLELKSLFRSPTWKQNLWMRILIVFAILYFVLIFLSLGVGAYYIIEEAQIGEPFEVINRYLIYYIGFDIVFRYMMQPMPVTNVQPLLYQNIKKSTIVHFSMLKMLYSFFNWSHLFFLIPLSIILTVEGQAAGQVWGWSLSIYFLLLINNYLNVLVNQKNVVFGLVTSLVLGSASLQYFGIFDITPYTQVFFTSLFNQSWLIAVAFGLLVVIYYSAFRHFRTRMYLDAGLAKKSERTISISENYFSRFGKLGLILRNDVALILRNKRARQAVFAGFFFIFYGLLFFTGAVEAYQGDTWKLFAGIFVTGGFLFSFGQYVPSWDSQYYPLLMTQNITYVDYLKSKYTLIQVFTAITTILSSWYLIFGLEIFSFVLLGAIYNLTINSVIVLWGGAYVRTKIDLTSNKKAFGDKNAFNYKTLLLTLPKILLPVIIYGVFDYALGPIAAKISIVVVSIAGYFLKPYLFKTIISIYQKEKYATLKAYRS
jgi:hypothetical protein